MKTIVDDMMSKGKSRIEANDILAEMREEVTLYRESAKEVCQTYGVDVKYAEELVEY